MSEKPYKLGQWFWGRLPELPQYSVVMWSASVKGVHPTHPQNTALAYQVARDHECWWCIVSDTPPMPPEPELRLSDGWYVTADAPLFGQMHRLGVLADCEGKLHSSIWCERQSRAECVRVIQAAVDAMEGVK